MIQNIMSFNETEAHDIMTHRKNVVAFDEEISAQKHDRYDAGRGKFPLSGI